MARAHEALGDHDAAIAAADEALQRVADVRSQFRSAEFKMGLFSDLQRVFEHAIGLHAQAGDEAGAFALSERSRARALLDSVRGRAPVPDSGSATLEQVQQALRADERMVEFHVLPDRLLVWVAGPDGTRFQELPVGRKELTELVETFRNSIVRGQRSAIANADKLGAAMLGPLGLDAGLRLIIVPHGPLHYLPFQALRTDGQYLIERNPVSVAPSAAIALQLAQGRGHGRNLLTAFGNPRIDDEHDLPGSEAEVRELARLFPDNSVYLGSQANKTRFLDVSTQSPILHLATHAEVDQVDPLYSRILLANEGGRNNFLEAHEILNLDMQGTALVTLSSCESGLGRVAGGDEVLGFTRSFLSVGVSSLIASLWPVSDDATDVLMQTAYRELAAGHDVQTAMRAGQLAVLARADMAHPFFWAPFNLIGDWRLTLGS